MRLDRSTERALAALLFPPGEVYEVHDLGSRARLAVRLREAAVQVESGGVTTRLKMGTAARPPSSLRPANPSIGGGE